MNEANASFAPARSMLEARRVGSSPNVDRLLVVRIAAGDAHALMELYDRHASLVFAIARGSARSRAEAEDLVHDTFVLVYERATAYDPTRGSVSLWLSTFVGRLGAERARGRRACG